MISGLNHATVTLFPSPRQPFSFKFKTLPRSQRRHSSSSSQLVKNPKTLTLFSAAAELHRRRPSPNSNTAVLSPSPISLCLHRKARAQAATAAAPSSAAVEPHRRPPSNQALPIFIFFPSENPRLSLSSLWSFKPESISELSPQPAPLSPDHFVDVISLSLSDFSLNKHREPEPSFPEQKTAAVHSLSVLSLQAQLLSSTTSCLIAIQAFTADPASPPQSLSLGCIPVAACCRIYLFGFSIYRIRLAHEGKNNGLLLLMISSSYLP